MCGVAGVFAYGEAAPPVDRAELLRMREQMAARGPDGAGSWIGPDLSARQAGGRVGFAYRRLAILDLSDAGAQPMGDPQAGHVIVFNGEI